MTLVTTSYKLFVFRSDRRRLHIRSVADYPDLVAHPSVVTAVPESAFSPLPAPTSLPIPASSPIYAGQTSVFWFWSVTGSFLGSYTSGDPNFTNPAYVGLGPTMQVTAWYFMPDGSTPDVVEVDAFSDESGAFVDATPIETCAPAAAQGTGDDDDLVFTDPAHVPATGASIVVVPTLPGDSYDVLPMGDPGQTFESFFFQPTFGSAGSADAMDPTRRSFHVPQASAIAAVATYRKPPPRQPPKIQAVNPILIIGLSDAGPVRVPIGTGPDPGPNPELGLAIYRMAALLTDTSSRALIQREALRTAQKEISPLLNRRASAPTRRRKRGRS